MKDFAAIDFETAIHHHTSVCECHGLTAQDTADALSIPGNMSRNSSEDSGFTIVVYNKEYDKPYLTKCHEHYGMLYSNYIFECIIGPSRRSFLELPNSTTYGFCHVGFNLYNYHHALVDAEACAAIANKIL